MRIAPFIFTALTLVTPTMVLAQAPSTQPTPELAATDQANVPPPGEERRGMRGDRMRGPGGWGGFGGRREWFNDDEWAAASEFMQQNFPQRWELYKTIEKTDRNRLIQQVKMAVVNRHRQLMRMERDNPVLYEAAMKHAKAEEDAYAAAKAAQEAPTDSQAQSGLRTQVEKLVEQTFSERKTRLEALRTTLEQQEKQLDDDRKNSEAMIKAQIERLTSDNPFRGPDATMNPNGARPDGPRPDGPRGERPSRDPQ